MQTLIVGDQDSPRHLFLERLLNEANTDLPLYGFMTTMSVPDTEETSEIHIHPYAGERTYKADNLVGLCRHKCATVFPETFEHFSCLLEDAPRDGIIIMDGIGPMEGEAPRFREAVLKMLGDEVPVLATVRDKDTEFLRKVRGHPNTKCFVLGEDDEKLFSEALEFFVTQINK